ncbi:hypothetical protein GCM10009678_36590 [Actinomadura kijaniata]|uniref:Integral membrane protein n=1 Tax=Actinomadura namibiensis TaxID=182080 RepID=A0A7W3QM41_ACTNM|nr:hypothetical protein [Actinomadura namibiensis]MBA8952167.1 hypothetical protein [Actinomadura namibiensis]
MDVAALVAWALAASAGGYLLVRWLAAAGLRGQPAKVTRHPTLVLVSHPASAVLGLCLWLGHLVTGRDWWAWAAFGVLIAVILQGVMLFSRWLVGGGGRHARGNDQPFPGVAVAVHALVAVTTFVLVFLATLETGR